MRRSAMGICSNACTYHTTAMFYYFEQFSHSHYFSVLFLPFRMQEHSCRFLIVFFVLLLLSIRCVVDLGWAFWRLMYFLFTHLGGAFANCKVSRELSDLGRMFLKETGSESSVFGVNSNSKPRFQSGLVFVIGFVVVGFECWHICIETR